MIATFVLLGAAVPALWLGGGERTGRGRANLWLWLFGVALLPAIFSGVLRPAGLALTAVWVAVAWGYFQRRGRGWQRSIAGAGVLLLATGLVTHSLPGFGNVRVLSGVHLTPEAAPFSLYLNFDKTVAGLFLLGWGQARLRRWQDGRAMLAAMVLPTLAVMGVVLMLSFLTGYVRLAPKWPAETGLWLAVNLLFTCMAEEAFFRGFIQERLQRWGTEWDGGRLAALGVAALLFGLAHLGGGWVYAVLATVAGAGYGWVYQKTGRIEASILAHFALNAVHFFLFTYPALAGPG